MGRTVALKKIRVHHPFHMGVPPIVLREIKILKALEHENMVKMIEVVSSKGVEGLDEEDEREDERRRREKDKRATKKEADSNTFNALTNSIHNTNDDNNDDVLLLSADKALKNSRDDHGVVSKQNNVVSNKQSKSKKDRVVDAREGFKGNLFLVLEYVSHDLTGLIDMAYKLQVHGGAGQVRGPPAA